MKKFVWRLQKVLDIKQKQSQLKRAELLGLAEKIVEKRSGLLSQKQILKTLLNDVANENADVRIMKQAFVLKSASANRANIENLKAEIAGLEIQRKEKIQEVLKIRKETQALEKLRERTKKEFIREQESLDQKLQDDRFSMSYARKILQK